MPRRFESTVRLLVGLEGYFTTVERLPISPGIAKVIGIPVRITVSTNSLGCRMLRSIFLAKPSHSNVHEALFVHL